ncbi:MAG: hypothetical protein V2J51_09650 [Erythrobacter sp.]|jgi:uncharacterized membrane protein YeaQ/YmgE (transglycosylase-associated protein family)|nr:hypothetical protein [Erythrobacter sp.]
MALILLMVIGMSAGWLASVISRDEAPRDVLRQVSIGLIASVLAGVLTNQGTLLGGLTLFALGCAIAAATIALVLFHAVAAGRANA